MIVWALLLISTLIAVELFLRLPLLTNVKGLTGTLGKSLKVMKSRRISDHWKEKAVQVYALRLFRHSIMVFVIILGALLLPFAIIGYLGAQVGQDMSPLLESLEGIGASTLFAIVYFVVRQRIAKRLGA